MISTTIQLGPITFADETTSGWGFSNLIDWFGQTEDKSAVVERPQGHGAFDVVRSLRASRAVSFGAVYVGTSQTDLEAAFDSLSAVGAEGPVLMTVTGPAGSTWRLVTVASSAVEDHRGRSIGRVAVDCIARDPRRYATGDWVNTPPPTPGTGLIWPVIWPATWPAGGSTGRVALVNAGKAPSSPVFRLNGGFDTALITSVTTGARIGFDRPIPVTSQVVIDTATRRAVIDGYSDVSRWLRWREWEQVPAGTTREFQFDVTGAVGTPTMDGRVHSAWW